MKIRLLAAFGIVAGLLSMGLPARAQNFTAISGTVTDPNGIPYSNATISAVLVPSTSGPWRLNGQPYAGTMPATSLDVNGKFTGTVGSNAVILPANTKWVFTVSIAPGILPPLGTGPQSFSTTAGVTVSGATQSLTSTLDALAPALTNFVSTGGTPCTAVADSLQYNNAGTFGCVNGSAVTPSTGAIALVASGATVQPLAISAPASPVQTAPLFSVLNNDLGTCQGLGCFGGVGAGSIQGAPVILDLEQNDGTPWLLSMRNSMAPVGDETVASVDTAGEWSLSGYSGTFAFLTSGVSLTSFTSYPITIAAAGAAVNIGLLGNLNRIVVDTSGPGGGPITTVTGQTTGRQIRLNDMSHLGTGLLLSYAGGGGADVLFNFPTSTGTTGQFLTSGGGGTTAMIWTSGSLVLPAALVTTAAASDNVTVTGMTSSGHCTLTATNALAGTNFAGTYISAKTTNQITVSHTVAASMNYDIHCTAN